MNKRKKLVIGNWKMNLNVPESTILIGKIIKEIPDNIKCEVVICPSYIDIYAAEKETRGTVINIGAQDVASEEKGAYTGEVSSLSLKGFVKYILVGHSERRNIFGENDKVVAKKAEMVVRHNIVPVICVGETLHEREDNLSKVVTLSQLEASIKQLTAEEIASCVIAYEPVWAIGTGHVCGAQEAEKMAKGIRGLVKSLYGEKISDEARILYGGSVTKENVSDIKEMKNIDGVLVGGASLDHKEFSEIVKVFGGKDAKSNDKQKQ